ncbi:MAG: DUF3192 domain-containing protein [Chlamydiota bacterium]|jgi:hypothetical protein
MYLAKLWLLLCAIFMATSCSNSPLITGVKAEENKYNMAFIKVGMSSDKVYSIMGRPYDIEHVAIDDENFEIWFYLTKRAGLGQTRMVPSNFTPLVFQDGYLVGWGNDYYNHLMDIENAKEKRREDLRQRYTDDEDEWPPNENQYLGPEEPLPLQETPEQPEQIQEEEEVRPGKQPRETKKYFSN